MRGFWILLACAAAMVVAQDAGPGARFYHYGWYNAIDVALLVAAGLNLRGLRRPPASRRFTGFAIALFGCAVVVFAGVASGLLGPDTHTVVGAPGAGVRDDEAGGTFVFPIPPANSVDAAGLTVEFVRDRTSESVGTRPRYTGGLILRQVRRTVVYVEAMDARGNHLTITQPANASFLSPVLLMQESATIAGMGVRFDTFAIPALARSVKAVYFEPAQAAQLRTIPPVAGTAAILFSVTESAGRPVRGGIGLVPSGGRRDIGGLTLSALAGTYPAITVASAPYLPVLTLGLLGMAAGGFRALKSRPT